MTARNEWVQDALCAQVGGDAWFPDAGDPINASKRVCQQCPVRATCLTEALENNEEYGTWGGLTAHERYLLKKGAA